ncbi:MAG: alpha/beta fold hydrolase [Sphingomonadaceae bacterium]|nr:alpha/beta fold hydrolase [Sphingomonadaceae bacterium]
MATYLMIHGAWHGGWSFEPLREGLEAEGHTLVAPDLPGIGGDDATLAAVTLEGWAEFVARLARAQDSPVILCGHSRGGIVISQAGERAPQAIAALVYISAFLIPPGRSLNDLVADVPRLAAFEAGLSPLAGGAALALTPEGAAAAFYHLSPEPARVDACARLAPEPVAPLATPLDLGDAGYGSIPRHYIECDEDRAIPLAQQRAMQAAQPVASVTTLHSDHSPFLTCPDALVEALLGIAEGVIEREAA